jgi:hypothetical protein
VDKVYSLQPVRGDIPVSKFKIGETVRLRPSIQAGRGVSGEYRIVQRLTQTDNIIRYRVRSSADEQDEVVARESELCGWQNSKVHTRRPIR